MKIATVIGTRPELIRLSVTIKLLDKVCEHTLIHTNQNDDPTLKDILFTDLGVRKPDLEVPPTTPKEFQGNCEEVLTQCFKGYRPDGILILGDTHSCRATTIVAKQLGIPLFHCEAGNRCWDPCVPEENNRITIDHAASFNLVYTELQRMNLIREGLHPKNIVKTGSPMKEVIEQYGAQSPPEQTSPYYAISVHRHENLINGAKWLEHLVNKLSEQCYCLVSCHPRLQQHIKMGGSYISPTTVKEWWEIQRHAKVVLSDSGTLPEESYYLNFPALHLRKTNERPEATETGGVLTVGTDPDRIMQAIETMLLRSTEKIQDYEISNFSQRVWSCLQNVL
jgi:UDP-N-acetylglucosamine 2-epimerase